jgi:hypothetical protein
VPRDAQRQAVCSVIYQNVYVIRPIDVSGLWSNYIPVIYQSASGWCSMLEMAPVGYEGGTWLMARWKILNVGNLRRLLWESDKRPLSIANIKI